MTKKKGDTAERVAELERELAKLKNAMAGKEDKPKPKKEFVPAPYQRYDPTAGNEYAALGAGGNGQCGAR